ncbi:MAG: hypothetical protein AB7U20_08355, partial [Planctomycetaceae bacterium]
MCINVQAQGGGKAAGGIARTKSLEHNLTIQAFFREIVEVVRFCFGLYDSTGFSRIGPDGLEITVR